MEKQRDAYSLPPAPCGRKNVYCQDVVKVEALDEEPVEHRCPRILDQNQHPLAKIRLKQTRMIGAQIQKKFIYQKIEIKPLFP